MHKLSNTHTYASKHTHTHTYMHPRTHTYNHLGWAISVFKETSLTSQHKLTHPEIHVGQAGTLYIFALRTPPKVPRTAWRLIGGEGLTQTHVQTLSLPSNMAGQGHIYIYIYTLLYIPRPFGYPKCTHVRTHGHTGTHTHMHITCRSHMHVKYKRLFVIPPINSPSLVCHSPPSRALQAASGWPPGSCTC